MRRWGAKICSKTKQTSCQDSEIRGIDDAEVVGDLIAKGAPVFGHGLCQERHRRRFEVAEGGIASVVGDVFVHHAP